MKTVLVVDDNVLLSKLSCEILRQDGYRAIAAFSAEEALEIFETQTVDVLVTDLRMEGMDGLDLARVAREKYPRLPVILVTAYGPVSSKHINMCLPKEGLFPGLLEHIRMCLGKGHAKPPAGVINGTTLRT